MATLTDPKILEFVDFHALEKTYTELYKIPEYLGEKIVGKEFSQVWIDDFDLPNICAFKFEHPEVPDATVKIFEERLDKHNPRNPDPAAGARNATEFIIKCGDRRIGGSYRTLEVAKMKAKPLHEKMVARILELREQQEIEKMATQRANPTFGRF